MAAAFLENYNEIVGVVRGDPSQQRNVGTNGSGWVKTVLMSKQ
jgi:hypothetical protein